MFGKLTQFCVCGLLFGVAFGGAANAANAVSPAGMAKVNPVVKSEALEFARKMGMGWNLGNTLEACGEVKGTSVRDFETYWGNPVTTKAMIDGIKASGFKSMRVPVAWSNMMASDYTINKELMARVKEVVKYGLDNDMYVIVNIHWDGGWINKFPDNYGESMRKYKAVWSQIADHFKDYSDHLIFESLNEESNFETLWNSYSNTPNQKGKAYKILNAINQRFTDIVRASGGKNDRRYLLIAGYMTNIKWTVDPAFQMPRDPAAHSMVSIHYYDPSTFTLLDKDASWGKAVYKWGTADEIKAVKANMLPLKGRFLDKGIPVVMGEFGCSANKDPASVAKYLSTVCETAYSMGIVPVLWEAGSLYNRRELKWNDPKVGEALGRIAADYGGKEAAQKARARLK